MLHNFVMREHYDIQKIIYEIQIYMNDSGIFLLKDLNHNYI